MALFVCYVLLFFVILQYLVTGEVNIISAYHSLLDLIVDGHGARTRCAETTKNKMLPFIKPNTKIY